MTGKPYHIKEMKSIVDYLIANKLYGEIRGRKMWINFANTEFTSRTWQSLKETFLKRILPDIHNPYYNLSTEQINSFRTGYDVNNKNSNKLEIHTVSDESNDQNDNDTAQSVNDYGIKEEIMAGENIKCSKIPTQSRSSADTVIVDTCYETAEDIQKDLESPGGYKEKGADKEAKSFRDCITYSEPLTPMLQEVLDDFQSEPEDQLEASDRDAQMEVHQTEPDSENIDKNTSTTVKENGESDHGASDIPQNATDTPITLVKETDPIPKGDKPKDKQNKNTQPSVCDEKDSDVVCLDDSTSAEIAELDITEKHNDNETLEIPKEQLTKNADTETNATEEVTIVHGSNSEIIHPSGPLNISNSTPDASLPNNPEALKKRTSDENNVIKYLSPENKTDNKVSRKRSSSEDTIKSSQNKKKKLQIQKTKAASETEGKKEIQAIIEHNPKSTKDQPMEVESIPKKIDKLKQSEDIASKSANLSTSIANDIDKILLTSDSDQRTHHSNKSPDKKNPCLQNVSLFDEQFNKTKYNTSDSEAESKKTDVISNKNEASKTKDVTKKQNEVVILKSHTESDTEEPITPRKKKLRPGVLSTKTERDKALGNLFGFSGGAGTSKRRKQLSRRRRTISQNNISQKGGSNSSEWTSEQDSEVYVSPPRCRKNRPTRKYLKPQSGRILSLEEEGGLFVMHGKKIYPLVKDGKLVKNYVSYLPDSDSEEDQNYWKLKYEEEKKKAIELKKLLKKSKYRNSRASTSSAAHPSPQRTSTSHYNPPEEHPSNAGKEICRSEKNEKRLEPTANTAENVKIRFTTKNDQEIHLEGNWSQLHNVLEHVVQIFHKEPRPISHPKPVVEPPSSGLSTPVVITTVHDPDVHEKVNKIENEIFKEIEERDKEEDIEPNQPEPNVTKRKAGRPRKSSVSQSPAKKQKISDQSAAKEPDVNGERKVETENDAASDESKKLNDATTDESKKLNDAATDESKKLNDATTDDSKRRDDATADASKKRNDATIEASKKLVRTPRRILNDSPKIYDTTTIQTRRSKLNINKTGVGNQEDEIRYMFPPKTTRQTVKTPTDKNSSQKPQRSAKKMPSSPETVCSNSLESTQGYQDTDPSPMKPEFRKKKMINLSEMRSKTISHVRRSTRKKSHPYACDDARGSSDLSLGVSVNKIERDNSTLNSDVYRSESYQLLMPGSKTTFKQLEPIDETGPVGNEVDFITHVDSTAQNEVFSVQLHTMSRNSGQADSDFGSSSNISLPLSPELSVVESLSVSRDLLNTGEGPTINEMQCNEEVSMVPATCSQYMISEIDVSVPLMQQDCGLESSNIAPDKPHNLVTESLLKKIGTINITDKSNVTDTLDAKLRDLFLESAKKMAVHNQINKMDVDEGNVETKKKSKNKKRCSTPRKRKDSTKSKKVPTVQAVVEEEHVESFAKGGRQSCPPIIQTLAPEVEINIADLTIAENVKPKGRKKKDIIKVKIVRPKSKKSANETAKSVRSSSKISTCTDSGITDTESGVLLRADESVDLIHNHSETCLHANDCIGDSIECVENSVKSLLTLSDSMQSLDDIVWQDQCEFSDAQNIIPDFFCNNAQDVKSFCGPKPDDIENCECETVYHSPLGTESSLITEDLSDDPPQPYVKPNKWYLLSEDETTNTNMANVREPPSNVASFGANLKQIFPITCAVPDLSTITEMSGDNDNSRKPTLEGVSSDFNSKSFFD